MKKLYVSILTLFFCSIASAASFKDFAFEQERMLIAEDGIYLISSFEENDKVTAYSHFGDPLWNTSFYAKITSWQVIGDAIIVFSKHRDGYKTFLTCLDRYTGNVLWQRP